MARKRTPYVLSSKNLLSVYLNRAPLTELQATRINPLQVKCHTAAYDYFCPLILDTLQNRAVVQSAKAYLVRTGNYSNVLTNPYYLYSSGLVSNYLLTSPSTAQTNIERLFSQSVSWGYNADILSALAFLQGLIISSSV